MSVLIPHTLHVGLLLGAAPAGKPLDPVPNPADVGPGWIAAVVFVGLFVGTILLWLSMRKQLGRIRIPGDDIPASDDPVGPAEDTRAPAQHPAGHPADPPPAGQPPAG